MQLAIELPDELGRQVLQHENVQEFAKFAFEKMLLEEKRLNEQKADLVMQEDNTQEILEMMSKIKPVKCEYSSEQIVRSLRDGTELGEK